MYQYDGSYAVSVQRAHPWPRPGSADAISLCECRRMARLAAAPSRLTLPLVHGAQSRSALSQRVVYEGGSGA
jgi:hypothetical protein